MSNEVLVKKYISLLIESQLSDRLEKAKAIRRAKRRGHDISNIEVSKYDPSIHDIGVVYQNVSSNWVYVILYKKFFEKEVFGDIMKISNKFIVKSSRKHFLKIKDPSNIEGDYLSYTKVKKGTMPFELENNKAYRDLGLVKCLGVFDAASVRNMDFTMSKHITKYLGSSSSQIIKADSLKDKFREYNLTVSDAEDIEAFRIPAVLKGKTESAIEDLKFKIIEHIEKDNHHTTTAICLIFGVDEIDEVSSFIHDKEELKIKLIQYYDGSVKERLSKEGKHQDNEVFKLAQAATGMPSHIFMLARRLYELSKGKSDKSLTPQQLQQRDYNLSQRGLSQSGMGHARREYKKGKEFK